MKITNIITLLLTSSLVACGGQAVKTVAEETPIAEEVLVEEQGVALEADAGNGNAIDTEADLAYTEINDPNSVLADKVIYFDFDQSNINSEFDTLLGAHADYLASRPGLRVLLQGYCDERGTREYNLALGEKRGLAVTDYFRVRGVADNQMETVSYGEDDPVDDRHGESAWAQNRRVHLVYQDH